MKKIQKPMAVLLSVCIVGTYAGKTQYDVWAAENVVVSPYNIYEINNGEFEGWGTSLCWWANRIGYSDSLAQQAADLFYGDNGLRLNIARFNIGGGDNPTHTHITRTDSNMPGYTVYNNGNVTYDWNADYNQRNVLLKSIEAAGEDMIVEMFSNSPPYYMTNSGCSSGGVDPNKNNLKDDCYDDFAEYFAEVCYQYENRWGVDIQSATPLNEPFTNFWSANSPKQEGCHFDQGESESKIILELQKSMDKRGLGDIILSGTDETSIDTQISSYNKLSANAKKALDRIDTHTYGGSKRSELKELAIKEGKNLWMSEVDGGSVAGTNAGEMGSALWLAQRITTDVNDLNASAWILWQVIDNHISKEGYNGNKDKGMVDVNGGFWGTAVADHDNDKIILTKKYYGFGQYTRFIRPGMTMLKSSGSTVAAYDKENEQLVIVAYNTGGSAKDMSFDLSGFGSLGATANITRTSATENWANAGDVKINGTTLNVSLPANSISTFVIEDVTGGKALENKINITKDMITGSNPWNNSENDCFKVFDGSTSTYFDGVGNGWVQADLGDIYDISAIGYAPRSGYEYRCPDGVFMVSKDGTNWENIYTIKNRPSVGMQYITRFNSSTAARYVRYQVPEGAPANQWNKDSTYCCNIAEIELYGTLNVTSTHTRIKPAQISGSNAWNDSANNYTKAFDGDISTFFDGVGDGWVQADLGGIYEISALGYAPRKEYEYRCADAMIQISQDGKSWKTVYTIPNQPAFAMHYIKEFSDDMTARYVRFTVPEGTPQNFWNNDNVYCCNISELEIYGDLTSSTAVFGDANCDGKVSIADAAAILQYLANNDKYTLSEQGAENADCCNTGSGITVADALAIQKLDAGIVTSLPIIE